MGGVLDKRLVMDESKVLAVRYHETGSPEAVLKIDELQIGEPEAGQARVRLVAAAINPSDLGMIGGSYGRLRELPAIAGREGIGEVEATGAGVTSVVVGDRVRMPEDPGVWTEAVCVDAAGLMKVPGDLDPDQAAMAFVNPPTAVRLLRDFVALGDGAWVIQNAGNSAVSICVAGLARKLGINVISTVRDTSKWTARLLASGAAAVVDDGTDFFKAIGKLTGGVKPLLALNSVGGDSVIKLIRTLADGGQCVTFGGMVGDKVRFPTRNLIFNDVGLRGFWMDRWFRMHSADEASELMDEVFQLIREGTFNVPVAGRFPLSRAVEAVAAAAATGRDGKVILTAG